MLSEVVVCSVCNAPKLTPTKREFIFKVCSCFGIEAKLLLVVVTKSEVILADVKRIKPITAEASPIIKPGLQKNSSSICSNSLTRKMNLPGVISLRNDLPTCATPKGIFFLVVLCTFAKFTKIPCAVSGRR